MLAESLDKHTTPSSCLKGICPRLNEEHELGGDELVSGFQPLCEPRPPGPRHIWCGVITWRGGKDVHGQDHDREGPMPPRVCNLTHEMIAHDDLCVGLEKWNKHRGASPLE